MIIENSKTRRNYLVLFILLVAMIFTFTPAKASAASSNITGYSINVQTVYTGPSSSLYVSTGSISANERVYVLGTERGWYHIVYDVNSGGQKSGYVPTNSLRNISGGTPGEDTFYGGYVYSNSAQTVYSCDDYTTKINIGSISAYEGVTKLYEYNASSTSHGVHKVYFIEYSTSNGAKRGYVFSPNFTQPSPTSVGRITMGMNVSYGVYQYNAFGSDKTSFGKVGFVGEGEYVAVIAKLNNDLLIEYNSPSGRKRGYVNSNYVAFYNRPAIFDDIPFSTTGTIYNSGSNMKVYAGPSSAYPSIGSIYAGDDTWISLGYNVNGYRPVQYMVTGTSTVKFGYIYMPLT